MIDNQETLWKIIFWFILVVIILYFLLNKVAKVVVKVAVKAEKYVTITSTKIKFFCIHVLNFIVSSILCFFVSAITIFLISFFINPDIEKVICLMIYSLIQGIKWVIFTSFIFSFITLYIVYKVNKNLKKNTHQEKDSRYRKGFKIFMCVMCFICITMYYFLMNILGECVAINKRVYTSFIDENEFYLVIGKIDGKYLSIDYEQFIKYRVNKETDKVNYIITDLSGEKLSDIEICKNTISQEDRNEAKETINDYEYLNEDSKAKYEEEIDKATDECTIIEILERANKENELKSVCS